jgi:hypothetical protein
MHMNLNKVGINICYIVAAGESLLSAYSLPGRLTAGKHTANSSNNQADKG